MTAVLADAQHWRAPLGVAPNEVLALINAHAEALDDVDTPTLVHFDLWPWNMLATWVTALRKL